MRVLFERPSVVVRYVAPGEIACDTLFVTFANWRKAPRLTDPGFGQSFFLKRGIPAVHVVTAGNDWFQSAEMVGALAACRRAMSWHARTVTYGSSMGGYGALLFSGLLEPDAAVAISPQFSIRPGAVEDRRWAGPASRLRFVFDDMALGISATAAKSLFYDPRNADAEHAERFRALGVRCHALPFSGHPSGALLHRLGLLARLQQDLAEDPGRDLAHLPRLCAEASAAAG